MIAWRDWLPMFVWLMAGAAHAAAEVGVVTLADSGTLILRGATWYKLVPGTAVEDADIVAAGDRIRTQVEFTPGTIASFVGEGSMLVTAGKDGPLTLTVPSGALKAVVKAPGVRVRTAAFEAATSEGILVMRVGADTAEVFVEAGSARLTDGSSPAVVRDAKRGEYWIKSAAGFASKPLAPKSFVDALPRHFIDPLPLLATRMKSKPVLVADHEITYAEAQPWLAGRDRAVFERRFASRLRDPAFRRAVEPHIARYPSWDRMLHPEKYAPKTPAPAK